MTDRSEGTVIIEGDPSYSKDELEKQQKHIYIIWVLFGAGFFTGWLTTIAGVIWAYVKREPDNSPFEASHYNYAISTFWWSLIWMVVGTVTSFIGVGIVVLFIGAIWFIYRVIKGLIKANETKIVD